MQTWRTNLALWFLIIGNGAFALLFWAGGYDSTVYVMAAFTFGVAVLIALTWASTAIEAFRSGMRQGEALLCAAVFGLAVYAVYVRVWSVAKVWLSYPGWMDRSPLAAYPSLLLLSCLVAILFAPGTRDALVPKRNLLYFVIAALIAGVMIGVVIGLAIARPADAGAMPTRMRLECPIDRPVFVNAFCRKRPNMSVSNGDRS